MVCDAPVRASDTTRPWVDFTVVKVDDGGQGRKLGVGLVGFRRPVPYIAVTAFITELGNGNWFAKTCHTIISRLGALDECRISPHNQLVIGLVAEHRQADDIEIFVTRIIGFQLGISTR